MTNIIPFNFESHSVRVIERGDELWFVAKDVADILGYSWAGSATIRNVPDQWKGVNSVLTPSGEQEMTVLSEQGLYFFLNRSDKPAALPLQTWIAGEVLPSIRKTGVYGLPNDPIIKMRLEQIEMDKRITKLETMLPAPTTHMTIMGYANAQGVSIDARRANALGRRAAALTNMRGLIICPVPDDRYGTVNSYPMSVLEEVLG